MDDAKTGMAGMRAGWVTAAGLRTHFVTAGNGPAMILLHGQGENWASWQRVIPALARTHTVYAVDLPGAGRSDRPAGACTPVSVYAGWLAALLDALALPRATLVGNSHGGLVSLRLALEDGQRVTALCLLDSAALGRETHPLLMALSNPGVGEAVSAWCGTPAGAAQWTWLLASVVFARPQRIPLAWYENACRLALRPGHMMSAVVASVRGQIDQRGQYEVLLDALPGLRIPTLVVWGSEDRVVPWRHGQDAARRLPHARLTLIPDCGHLPQVERPDALVAALADFLATIPAPGVSPAAR